MLGELRFGAAVGGARLPNGLESPTRVLNVLELQVGLGRLTCRAVSGRLGKRTGLATIRSSSNDRILREAPLIVWEPRPTKFPLSPLKLIIARAFLQGCI